MEADFARVHTSSGRSGIVNREGAPRLTPRPAGLHENTEACPRRAPSDTPSDAHTLHALEETQ